MNLLFPCSIKRSSPKRETRAWILCACAIVAVALTDLHASLTLNVLLVYEINVVTAAPCVACGFEIGSLL